MRLHARRLALPGICLTLDTDTPGTGAGLEATLEIFARHRVPVTLFTCNRTADGREHYDWIRGVVDSAKRRGPPLEVASHGMNHVTYKDMSPDEAASRIAGSLKEFADHGIPVRGFRSPFLSLEDGYREALRTIDPDGSGLAFESSINFESTLPGSLFHALMFKKCPHVVNGVWELPISCLDDHQLLVRRKHSERFAFHYWRLEMRMWIRRRHYCMVLLHPRIMCRHLELLDRLLADGINRHGLHVFHTCSGLVQVANGDNHE